MKHLSCILIVAILPIGVARAESLSITNSPFKVILEPTKERDFRPDPAHTRDGKIVYTLIGHVFSASEGEIKPASGSTPRSNALETFSEVLSAYAVKDIEKMRALYTPDSSNFFASILAKPESKKRWLQMAGGAAGATALMSFEHKGQTLLFARVQPAGYVMPLAFVKVENQLLCSPKIDGSDVMLTNLMLALVNFKMTPADIVAP